MCDFGLSRKIEEEENTEQPAVVRNKSSFLIGKKKWGEYSNKKLNGN